MKVIKKINNNVALCLDGNQRELIAFGKGIGFKPIPYELTDLSVIERTYYGISPEYQGLLKEIPKEIFDVSGMLVDLAANSIDADFNRNLVITLADHINFAIDRYKKNIHIKPPYVGNLAYLHEAEYKVATQDDACHSNHHSQHRENFSTQFAAFALAQLLRKLFIRHTFACFFHCFLLLPPRR